MLIEKFYEAIGVQHSHGDEEHEHAHVKHEHADGEKGHVHGEECKKIKGGSKEEVDVADPVKVKEKGKKDVGEECEESARKYAESDKKLLKESDIELKEITTAKDKTAPKHK